MTCDFYSPARSSSRWSLRDSDDSARVRAKGSRGPWPSPHGSFACACAKLPRLRTRVHPPRYSLGFPSRTVSPHKANRPKRTLAEHSLLDVCLASAILHHDVGPLSTQHTRCVRVWPTHGVEFSSVSGNLATRTNQEVRHMCSRNLPTNRTSRSNCIGSVFFWNIRCFRSPAHSALDLRACATDLPHSVEI